MAARSLRAARLFAVALVVALCPARALPQNAPGPEFERTFHERLDSDFRLYLDDNRQFYSPRGLGLLAGGIAAAAPIANTSADRDIRDWYQHRIKRDGLDPVADVFNYGGQAWVLVPVTLELMALNGRFGEDWQHDGGILEWSNRCCRAIAVGYPPVISLYGILGSGRPYKNDSHWHPFEDFHGVSGHTFIGAVPWLTAAAMTDNYFLKVPLVAGSFLTGWSRLHDDKHYASQIALGWWIAALTVLAVDQTQIDRGWRIMPTVGPEGTGVALELKF